ncbi:hypothetical protein BDN70DRAFT_871881 [Pholiota conissans]|uniref:Uncharacterized protein n=1 Tax=Pholiota conissans TaxID=109636 RepID=A0A9P5ZCH0_9AGAR|nr:hypothetical protein BDN70DRAFT_871881 [Pholiota conissans]
MNPQDFGNNRQSHAVDIPRRYQEEVFEKAQQGNVIAALNTGSGKTLISLLLIKWITSQEASQGKLVIFLVPKVTLVIQQWEYLKSRSSLRIGKLHGSGQAGRSMSDRRGWKKMFKSVDVVVMTAQIFLNLLTHSLWSLDRVSLIVFDECHHARSYHPYNGIMREYFQVSQPSMRPKIFGMTASPIWNVNKPLESIATLEANMDAKIITVVENRDELLGNSPRATELIVNYPPHLKSYNYPSPTIYDCFRVIPQEVWNELDIPWQKLEVRYHATLWNVGPYCASLFLYLEIQHYLETIIMKNKAQFMDGLLDRTGMDIIPSSGLQPKPFPEDLFLILDILEGFKSFFPPDMKSPDIPISVDLDWCTPKVKVLVNILLNHYTLSPDFQGIIFVEQRQVASTLAKILQVIPELSGKIKCSFIVGEGVSSDGASKQKERSSRNPIELFRKRVINILIATSVAEEGLDFPDCELVVRFDDLHHMVGYVQSRGRARNKRAATFIVMIEENDIGRLQQFQKLQRQEPKVNLEYQTRHATISANTYEEGDDDAIEDVDEQTYQADLLERERYVEPSTGAMITYDNALSLLSYLCSIIPRDAFTPVHKPQYTDNFTGTLRLPRALPLNVNDLSYVGPTKRTYKEARRAVAFMAVMRLRKLNVFNEYLLPVSTTSDDIQEASPKKSRNKHHFAYLDLPPMLKVPVRDPWCIGDKLWLHPIIIDGESTAGLVTSTALPPEEAFMGQYQVKTLPPKLLVFPEDSELESRAEMKKYTELGIFYNNTASPFPPALSFYLVPITKEYMPDFRIIHKLLENPKRSHDWSQISEEDKDDILVLNMNRFGSVSLLRRIRYDLTPTSCPLPGSRESMYPTYREYWIAKWSRKKYLARVPTHGPLLETLARPRSNIGSYSLDPVSEHLAIHSAVDGRLLPLGASNWLSFPSSLQKAFEVLPELCARMTHAYRTRCARGELRLPSIPDSLLIEALTIPSATFPFNNQRLETLGDAVLQLCTTVHLLNLYPNRHEGQLSLLRQKFVNNKYLMHRALDLGLETFINSEIPSVYRWRYVLDDDSVRHEKPLPERYVTREYPRRSLQDCMEALLGASFYAGGIPLSLQMGSNLGLEFGGPLPWPVRYHNDAEPTNISALFAGLEDLLGYKFRHNYLLLESLTHPSVMFSEAPSYQRLEFLGDAVLDLVVVKYLYDKFPDATSHQLAHPRTKAICAPTLANVAVRKLGLHNRMLLNNIELNVAIDHYAPLLANVSGAEIVRTGWKYDPPKALSDIFESLIGAVLVDSNYNYEKTASVVEYIMDDVLEALTPDIAKDPVSEVVEWSAKNGCRRLTFRTETKTTERWTREGITVAVHGQVVVGPIVSTSLNVAKFLAAERALAILRNPESPKSLSCLCDCAMSMDVMRSNLPGSVLGALHVDHTDLFNNDYLEEEYTHGVVDAQPMVI